MAVVAFYENRDGKIKHMNRDRNRHAHHLLSENDDRPPALSAVLLFTHSEQYYYSIPYIIFNPKCRILHVLYLFPKLFITVLFILFRVSKRLKLSSLN